METFFPPPGLSIISLGDALGCDVAVTLQWRPNTFRCTLEAHFEMPRRQYRLRLIIQSIFCILRQQSEPERCPFCRNIDGI